MRSNYRRDHYNQPQPSQQHQQQQNHRGGQTSKRDRRSRSRSPSRQSFFSSDFSDGNHHQHSSKQQQQPLPQQQRDRSRGYYPQQQSHHSQQPQQQYSDKRRRRDSSPPSSNNEKSKSNIDYLKGITNTVTHLSSTKDLCGALGQIADLSFLDTVAVIVSLGRLVQAWRQEVMQSRVKFVEPDNFGFVFTNLATRAMALKSSIKLKTLVHFIHSLGIMGDKTRCAHHVIARMFLQGLTEEMLGMKHQWKQLPSLDLMCVCSSLVEADVRAVVLVEQIGDELKTRQLSNEHNLGFNALSGVLMAYNWLQIRNEDLFSLLCGHMAKSPQFISTSRGRNLTHLIEALAGLQIRHEAMIGSILENLQPAKLADLPPHYFARCVLAVAQLGVTDQAFISRMKQVLVSGKGQLLDLKDATSMLMAFVIFNVFDTEAFSLLSMRLQSRVLDTCSSEELSTVLWCCTKMGFNDPVLYEKVKAHFLSRGASVFETWKPREIGLLLYAYAGQIQQPEQELFQLISSSACLANDSKLKEFDEQDLINVIWSFANVGFIHEELQNDVSSEFVRRKFDCHQMVIALWSFACLKGGDEEKRKAVVRHLTNSLSDRLAQDGDIESDEVGNLLWAFASLGVQDEAFLEHLVSKYVLGGKLEQFKSKTLSSVVWSLARLGWTKEKEIFNVAIQECKKKNRVFKSNDLCNLLWGFACVGLLGREIVEAVKFEEGEDEKIKDWKQYQQVVACWKMEVNEPLPLLLQKGLLLLDKHVESSSLSMGKELELLGCVCENEHVNADGLFVDILVSKPNQVALIVDDDNENSSGSIQFRNRLLSKVYPKYQIIREVEWKHMNSQERVGMLKRLVGIS